MHDFTRLRVWDEAREIAVAVYELTEGLPSDERFGLISQLRRSAVSIGANIAEGSSRASNQDFARFIGIAAGSAAEVEAHLLIARALHLADDGLCQQVVDRTRALRRMLRALQRRLEQGGPTSDPLAPNPP